MMPIKPFCLALLAFLCLNAIRRCSGNDDVPLVRVKQGLVEGIVEKSVNGREFYSYMSIPYAESPEGKLRFKPPVPKDSWDGILDGTKMPISCLQTGFFEITYNETQSVNIQGREDCLYLNVYTHVPNGDKKLPVMVWIHGGGFLAGGATFYRPYALMNRDIVVVVIQYRLGIFGFLSAEDSVLPGNMGLKDQQLALKWIKENIEAFGGDSNSITIFGESAGGTSTTYQVLSPGSKGLFNRAIIQSGTPLCPWASNRNHRRFAIETGVEFNCPIDFGTEKYLECMQKVNPYYLILAAEKTNIMGFNPYYVLPGVDGEFIEEDPEILLKKGKYNKVEIMMGVTRDEGGLDLIYDYKYPTRRDNINKNFETLGAPSLFIQDDEDNPLHLAKQIYKFYLNRDDTTITEKDKKALVEMNTDREFTVYHDIVANIFAADPEITLFTYQLDYYGHVSLFGLPEVNRSEVISHCDDLLYLFDGGEYFSQPLKHKDDLKMREIFLDLWTNFAKTGNPTPSGSDFTWNKATRESFRHLSINLPPVMKDDNFQKKRKFWSSLKTISNSLLKKAEEENFREEL